MPDTMPESDEERQSAPSERDEDGVDSAEGDDVREDVVPPWPDVPDDVEPSVADAADAGSELIGFGGEPLPPDFRSGFAALIARPNAGKSTLINHILDTHVSIVTHKPQTTRNRIRAIHTVEDEGQIIFVDTPGVHLEQKRTLNEVMVESALGALSDADVVLFLVDATDALDAKGEIAGPEQLILDTLADVSTPVLLVINKIDLFESRDDEALERVRAAYSPEALESLIDGVEGVFEISALHDAGLDALVDATISQLPVGPMLYPPDMYTDQIERFMAAEMIRKQTMVLLRQEVPYSIAVEIEQFEEDGGSDTLRLGAVIHVERPSQKGIVIGRRGSMIKKIGTRARKALERFFGRKVYLDTFVRVQRDWAEDEHTLAELGYRRD